VTSQLIFQLGDCCTWWKEWWWWWRWWWWRWWWGGWFYSRVQLVQEEVTIPMHVYSSLSLISRPSQSKWKLYLSRDHSIPVYRPKHTFDIKTAIWLYWLSKKKSTHPYSNSNQQELNLYFQKAQLTPYKTRYMFFSFTSRPGSNVHKPTPCHCP